MLERSVVFALLDMHAWKLSEALIGRNCECFMHFHVTPSLRDPCVMSSRPIIILECYWLDRKLSGCMSFYRTSVPLYQINCRLILAWNCLIKLGKAIKMRTDNKLTDKHNKMYCVCIMCTQAQPHEFVNFPSYTLRTLSSLVPHPPTHWVQLEQSQLTTSEPWSPVHQQK